MGLVTRVLELRRWIKGGEFHVGSLSELEVQIEGRKRLKSGYVSRLQPVSPDFPIMTSFGHLAKKQRKFLEFIDEGREIWKQRILTAELDFRGWIEHTRADSQPGVLRRSDLTVLLAEDTVQIVYRRPLEFVVKEFEYNFTDNTVVLIDHDDQRHPLGVLLSNHLGEEMERRGKIAMLQVDQGIMLSAMHPQLRIKPSRVGVSYTAP